MTDSDHEDWEAICRRCGRCCFEKIEHDDGRIEQIPIPCKYLDVNSRLCLVYERRFELCPDCLPITPLSTPALAWLPDDCAYRPYIEAHQKRRESL